MASSLEKDEDGFLGVCFLLILQKHDNVLNNPASFQVLTSLGKKKVII